MSLTYQVWVLELAVLKANAPLHGRPTLKHIAYWDIWECFNTRSEAVAARKKSKLSKQYWRIRKYVPAEAA